MWNYIKNNRALFINKSISLPLNNKIYLLDNIRKPDTPNQQIAGTTVSELVQLLFSIVAKECQITITPPSHSVLHNDSEVLFRDLCNASAGSYVTIRSIRCNKSVYNNMINPKNTNGLREVYRTLASPKVLTKWLNKTIDTNYVTDIMYNKNTLIFLRIMDHNEVYTTEKKVLTEIAIFLVWIAWLKTAKLYKSTPSVDNLVEVYAEAVKRKGILAEELIDIFADWLEKWHQELHIDIEKLIKENFKVDYTARIAVIQEEINTLNEDIKRYTRAVTDRINTVRERQTHIESLLSSKDDTKATENLIRMLKTYKTIVDFDFSKTDNYLYYTVINNIKVDSAEDWKRNLDRRVLTEKQRKLIYLALTTEDVNLRAIYRFAVSPTHGFDWNYKCNEIASDTYNAIRHPHLYHYQCYGNNTNIINECYREQDFIALIEQTIEVVARLNWADSPVVGKLIEDITYGYYNKPMFEYEGTEFSLNDFTAEGAQIYETISKKYPDT